MVACVISGAAYWHILWMYECQKTDMKKLLLALVRAKNNQKTNIKNLPL